MNHVHSEGGGAVYAEDDNTLEIGTIHEEIQRIMVVCCLLMRIIL